MSGKKLPTLEQTLSFSKGFGQMSDGRYISAIGVISDNTPDQNNFIADGKGFVSLMTSPEFNMFLYRGETEPHCPCLSSILRLKADDRFVQVCKQYELELLLKSNIAVRKWRNTFENVSSESLPFKVDYTGLAQHYGISTELYDFTNNKDVALFFAYCESSKNKDGTITYSPITDESKTAILYTLNLPLAQESKNVDIIGMQPLMRPGVQHAFSLRQRGFDCLNSCGFVNKEELPIKKSESEKYYNMFEGGNKLFPKEKSLEKIELLKNSKAIHEDVIDSLLSGKYMGNFASTMQEAKERFAKLGYEVKNKTSELTYTADENTVIEREYNSLFSSIKSNFRMISPMLRG